jgi:16S rRNA (cytosine967-C5)-methyltransferase
MKAGKLRATAATTLSKLLSQDGSLSALSIRQDPEIDLQDAALLQELCFGTCRWYFRLNAILRQLLPKPLKAKDSDLRCLLLLGIYQLQYLRIPDYAVVNESVAATQLLGKGWAKALVNGVLRNYLRQSNSLLEQADREQESLYAHPKWLIQALQKAWPSRWEAILTANNLHPPMTLRTNILRLSTAQFLSQLAEAGIAARAGALASSSVYLESPCPVAQIPGFEQGHFSVQDEASQLLPDLMALAPGLSVLDACAAPGGKTCHILESCPDLARLIALDNDARRLPRVHDNLQRLGLQAEVLLGDAGDPAAWWDGRLFDRILLDAPCSATGIIRRHPDIKLLRRPADISRLSQIQWHLLSQLWSCLAPGGLLLYSSCSILPAENSDLVTRFLSQQQDAKLEEIKAEWGVECVAGRQLLPDSGGNDGFFFARLRKLSP